MPPREKTEIDLLPYQIKLKLDDAIRHEDMARKATDFRDRLWHEDQSRLRFDQAFWLEKRLDFLRAGL